MRFLIEREKKRECGGSGRDREIKLGVDGKKNQEKRLIFYVYIGLV